MFRQTRDLVGSAKLFWARWSKRRLGPVSQSSGSKVLLRLCGSIAVVGTPRPARPATGSGPRVATQCSDKFERMLDVSCQAHDKQLQGTVRDLVLTDIGEGAA